MNITEELEREHSRAQALKIATYACASKKNFRELMRCFMSDDYRLAQRAAWSVSWAARNNPPVIDPYIQELVSQMQRVDMHPAVVRNAVRIFEDITVPEAFQGEVMHVCFSFVENPVTAAAVKASALTVLFNLSRTYPEIIPELSLLINERWDTEGFAFRARGRQILKAFSAKR